MMTVGCCVRRLLLVVSFTCTSQPHICFAARTTAPSPTLTQFAASMLDLPQGTDGHDASHPPSPALAGAERMFGGLSELVRESQTLRQRKQKHYPNTDEGRARARMEWEKRRSAREHDNDVAASAAEKDHVSNAAAIAAVAAFMEVEEQAQSAKREAELRVGMHWEGLTPDEDEGGNEDSHGGTSRSGDDDNEDTGGREEDQDTLWGADDLFAGDEETSASALSKVDADADTVQFNEALKRELMEAKPDERGSDVSAFLFRSFGDQSGRQKPVSFSLREIPSRSGMDSQPGSSSKRRCSMHSFPIRSSAQAVAQGQGEAQDYERRSCAKHQDCTKREFCSSEYVCVPCKRCTAPYLSHSGRCPCGKGRKQNRPKGLLKQELSTKARQHAQAQANGTSCSLSHMTLDWGDIQLQGTPAPGAAAAALRLVRLVRECGAAVVRRAWARGTEFALNSSKVISADQSSECRTRKLVARRDARYVVRVLQHPLISYAAGELLGEDFVLNSLGLRASRTPCADGAWQRALHARSLIPGERTQNDTDGTNHVHGMPFVVFTALVPARLVGNDVKNVVTPTHVCVGHSNMNSTGCPAHLVRDIASRPGDLILIAGNTMLRDGVAVSNANRGSASVYLQAVYSRSWLKRTVVLKEPPANYAADNIAPRSCSSNNVLDGGCRRMAHMLAMARFAQPQLSPNNTVFAAGTQSVALEKADVSHWPINDNAV